MKKIIAPFMFLSLGFPGVMTAQHVGIGTTSPLARLHIVDSSVLFTGSFTFPSGEGNPPVSGQGTRMMWYPQKAAFRTGYTQNTNWDKDSIGFYSFATGFSTKAKGNQSFAAGIYSSATGSASFAMGSNNLAAGQSSMAQGNSSQALGYNSIALGNSALATGTGAVAIGTAVTAAGQNAFATGYYSEAPGSYAFSAGRENVATGYSAVSLGYGTTAAAFGETSIGLFNESISNTNATNWIGTDPLFQIGNGMSYYTRSTAFFVRKDGFIGINTVQPQARLHLAGNQITDGHLQLRRNSYTGSPNLTLTETGSNDGARLQFRSEPVAGKYWELYGYTDASDNADALFNIYYEGVGNNMMLRGNGNVWFRGSVSQNSDARLKKDIVRIGGVMEKLQQINGYHYTWKDSLLDQGLQSGVLAQEIEQSMPELVHTAADGTKSVNYTGLIPYLVEALKAQQKEIDELKKRVISR